MSAEDRRQPQPSPSMLCDAFQFPSDGTRINIHLYYEMLTGRVHGCNDRSSVTDLDNLVKHSLGRELLTCRHCKINQPGWLDGLEHLGAHDVLRAYPSRADAQRSNAEAYHVDVVFVVPREIFGQSV